LRRVAIITGLLLFAADVSLGAEQPKAVLPVVEKPQGPDAPANSPVLAAAVAPGGWLLVGGNKLTAFDGNDWQVIETPGAYGFRAIAPADSGRVYLGCIGDLGYVEKDVTGAWQFTSLKQTLLLGGGAVPGDVWAAYPSGDGAWFVTRKGLLRWDGVRFTSVVLPEIPGSTFPDRA
jgi:hypothetical protein